MIVVLDGLAANPGDISWAPLEAYSSVKAYDVTHPEDLIARAAGYEMVITNKTPFDEKTLDQLPDLKYIGVLATGYNVVDIEACRKRGIWSISAGAWVTPWFPKKVLPTRPLFPKTACLVPT